MRNILLAAFMVFQISHAVAQDETGWRQAWHDLMSEDDQDSELAGDALDLLEELAAQPLDLNSATRDELERLPFLSALQVMDLLEYRDRFGPLRSMGELRMVKSMDYRQLQLLPYFVCLVEPANEERAPRLSQLLRNGHHELTASGRIPFYERKGDRNGYLGYKYRHWLRYEYRCGDRLRMGLIGAQDAGEPFFANRNQWGYDTYHYYVQLRQMGPLVSAVVGHYKLSAGMGLVLGSGFSPGKQAMLQRMGRPVRMVRAHTSRSSTDHFRGAAATLALSRSLQATVFASYRPIDATLAADSSARTLLTTGYHRTPAEMQKKGNTLLTDAGLSLVFRRNGINVGLTAVYSHLSRPLQPAENALYRRYQASGSDFLNAGIDYGIVRHAFALSGETAIDRHGHAATLHTVTLKPADGLSLMALHRFYSYRYTSLHAHAFAEGSGVQNEQGFYVGTIWKPSGKLQFSAYFDAASFPWARYRVSRPSSAHDCLATLEWQPHRRWTLAARYRWHRKEQDDSTKTALATLIGQRMRLSLSYDDGQSWATRTQVDVALAHHEVGRMLSQRVDWRCRWLSVGLMGGWFATPSYDTRIYVYERQLPGEYGFPMYYGRGFRFSLMANARIGRTWQLAARLGHTHYTDRTTIGSGLQQIDAAQATDLELQVKCRIGGN